MVRQGWRKGGRKKKERERERRRKWKEPEVNESPDEHEKRAAKSGEGAVV